MKQRQQIRKQRRIQSIQALWRLGWMSGIFAGVVWVATQPDWMISKPAQIKIKGNRYLSDTAIRSMLAIPYPQSILQLAPAQLTSQLLQHGSIINATIDRELLPPRLLIQIEDRPPVAQILLRETTAPPIFLNERGAQLPISSYRSTIQPTAAKLRVMLPDQGVCPNWAQLYPVIRTSPVSIGIIDCRDPQNLILQTEVGKVRLGNLGDNQRLVQQIQQLDLLRDWRKYINPLEVDCLDLENPNSPKLQLKRAVTVTPKLS